MGLGWSLWRYCGRAVMFSRRVRRFLSLLSLAWELSGLAQVGRRQIRKTAAKRLSARLLNELPWSPQAARVKRIRKLAGIP